MRSSRSARRPSRAVSLAALAAGALLIACDGDRLRPGPPDLTLSGPGGGTVFSPDTVAIEVHAADANGLDIVTLDYLGQVITIDAFARSEIDDFVFFFIPEGLAPDQLVVISAVAVDLAGQETAQTLTLTVIARP